MRNVFFILAISSCQVSAQEASTVAPPLKIQFDAPVTADTAMGAIRVIELAQSSKTSYIIFEIDSPGGSVMPGFALAKAIEASKIPIVCVVDGMAASMAFYILQSCPVRLMTKRSVLMIHEARIEGPDAGGTEIQCSNSLERLRVMNKAMSEHLGKRMAIEPKALRARLTSGAEWWMDWEEAIRTHSVDNVIQ